MIQVQVRLPNNSVKYLDSWIKKGYFENRSDALRTILQNYTEKEKIMDFYNKLNKNNLLEKNDYKYKIEEMKLLEKGVRSLKDNLKKTKLKYLSQDDFEKKYNYLEK